MAHSDKSKIIVPSSITTEHCILTAFLSLWEERLVPTVQELEVGQCPASPRVISLPYEQVLVV